MLNLSEWMKPSSCETMNTKGASKLRELQSWVLFLKLPSMAIVMLGAWLRSGQWTQWARWMCTLGELHVSILCVATMRPTLHSVSKAHEQRSHTNVIDWFADDLQLRGGACVDHWADHCAWTATLTCSFCKNKNLPPPFLPPFSNIIVIFLQ